jgi:hypothetical protein
MILFWNCSHGVLAKFDIIKHYIQDYKPVLFFISEAEIKKDRDYGCIAIPGYQIEVAKTIDSVNKIARSLVYVKSDSKFKRCHNLEDNTSELIVMSDGKIKVCGVYRPFKTVGEVSRSDAFATLLGTLDKVLRSPEDIVIGGDWNVVWNSESSMKKQLEEWSEEHGLLQSVDAMTRHQIVRLAAGPTVQESCIDLVFQRFPRKVNIVQSIGSDHCILGLSLQLQSCAKVVTKRIITTDWRNYNAVKVNECLRDAMKKIPCHGTGINAYFEWVNNCLVETCNEVIPKRTVRLRGDGQFENSRIEAIKKRRDRAYKKFKKTGNIDHLQKSKSLTSTLKRVIKKEQKRVFRAKMSTHGASSFWRTVGEVFKNCGVRESISLELDGQLVSDGDTISQAFATFFKEKVCSLLDKSEAKIEMQPDRGVNAEWIGFSNEEIERAMDRCRRKKSSGHDEIPMLVLKDCKDTLIPVLNKLFNGLMERGWFPDDWKIARVTPIFKKGSKTSIMNYRPVSNLCSLSKVFERCLLSRLEDVIVEDNAQHGFREHHGTVTAILELQSHVSSFLDQKKETAVYTIDMSAAFDLLRPQILGSKLSQVPKKLEDMVMNFLYQRQAFVSIEGHTSSVFSIPVGVPQGSVLGPKLFSIYTAGLSDVLEDDETRVIVYADDSYIVCSASSKEELVQNIERKLVQHSKWLRELGMVVNTSKTEMVYFSKDSSTMSVQCEGHSLVSKHELNVLGVIVDSKMSWEPQLRKVKLGCQRFKPALRFLRSKLKKKELIQVISAHYYSKLYYCSEVWYTPLKSKLRDTISPLHYSPLRLIFYNKDKMLSRKELNRLSKRASPPELNDFKIAKMLISIVMNQCPFVLYHDLLSHSVLERRKPHNPSFFDTSRSRIGKQSFSNRVNIPARKINFQWLHIPLSKDTLRLNLKKSFFEYYSHPESF